MLEKVVSFSLVIIMANLHYINGVMLYSISKKSI